MTTILLNITHGFQARMLLRSAVARRLLAAGSRLVICTPNANETYFQQEFSRPGIILEQAPQHGSRVEARLQTLKQYLLMNPKLGETLNYKREAMRRDKPWQYRISRALNPLLGRVTLLRRAYQVVERRCFRGGEFFDLLSAYRPDLVVTGTPGYHVSDAHLLRAAASRGVPTATVMLSWDNLTSKGCMNAMPDHLLVWSQMMKDEAITYHDYPSDQIDIVGAAQFDHYAAGDESFDRKEWREERGIADDDVLIVYGTINPRILPHEFAIVRKIAEMVRSDAFDRPAHLWVRLHPQAIRGVYAQALDPYRQLAGPRITIEEPSVQSEALAWDLPSEDANHLANLLCAADIVATPSSTLAIDAACCDTPIVSVNFDAVDDIPRGESAKRFLHYTHYAKLLTTGGMTVANDPDQFIRQVNRYGSDRMMDAEGRSKIIRQQLGCLDGKAASRTAVRLLELAGGDKLPIDEQRDSRTPTIQSPSTLEQAASP